MPMPKKWTLKISGRNTSPSRISDDHPVKTMYFTPDTNCAIPYDLMLEFADIAAKGITGDKERLDSYVVMPETLLLEQHATDISSRTIRLPNHDRFLVKEDDFSRHFQHYVKQAIHHLQHKKAFSHAIAEHKHDIIDVAIKLKALHEQRTPEHARKYYANGSMNFEDPHILSALYKIAPIQSLIRKTLIARMNIHLDDAGEYAYCGILNSLNIPTEDELRSGKRTPASIIFISDDTEAKKIVRIAADDLKPNANLVIHNNNGLIRAMQNTLQEMTFPDPRDKTTADLFYAQLDRYLKNPSALKQIRKFNATARGKSA